MGYRRVCCLLCAMCMVACSVSQKSPASSPVSISVPADISAGTLAAIDRYCGVNIPCAGAYEEDHDTVYSKIVYMREQAGGPLRIYYSKIVGTSEASNGIVVATVIDPKGYVTQSFVSSVSQVGDSEPTARTVEPTTDSIETALSAASSKLKESAEEDAEPKE